MRPCVCLAMLAPLCAAGASQAGAAEAILPEIKPAIERPVIGGPVIGGPAIGGEVSANAAPLDLSFDPPLPAEQRIRPAVRHADPASPGRDAEAAFSLGFAIKTRRALPGPPRRGPSDPEEPPTLTDKVEGVVERAAFGLTGKYRF